MNSIITTKIGELTGYLITPVFFNKLRSIRAYAEANPLSMDDMLDMMNGDKRIAKDPGRKMDVDGYIFITFLMEEQNEGLMRHLSIGSFTPGEFPTPEIVDMVMMELGFRGTHNSDSVFGGIEKNKQGIDYLNLLEYVDPLHPRP